MFARRNWLPLCKKDSFISSLASAAEADPQPKEHGLEYAISLCRQGQLHGALNFIQSLYVRGVRPNSSAYAYIVHRCASMKSLLAGQRVHALIISDGLERDGALFGNLLVSMYGKCGTPDDARRVFNRMQHRDSQSWKTMVAAYACVGHGKKACELLQRMLAQRVMPDNGTIINTLNACSSPAALEDGKLVHAYIVANDFLVDIAIKNSLITMYGKCGSLDLACKVFADTVERDVVTWTAIITAFTKQGHGKEALQFFKQMLKESMKPDRVTFISTLEACASIEALGVGKLIHAQTIESGTESDVFVGTALLNMYGKCGCLYSAQFLFQKMRERNIVAWNAMITAYAQHRLCKEALEIFFQLQQDGLKVNNVTFISVLNACSRPADLVEGKLIHYLMVESGVGIQSDVIVGTALVSMYSECGSLDDAQRMFNLLINKNVVSWTALLSAHVEHGNLREAFALFCQMQQEGVNPNHITFLTVLDACANPKVLAMGELIFSMIMENELKLDAFLSTTLVVMYSKCGKLEDARRVFTSIQQKNVVLFTAMIAAYAQFNHAKEALHMFEQMCCEGLKPDEFTFSSILDALTSLSALMDGKLVHNLIIDRNMELESSVGIDLMNMYGKCGALDDAHIVFDKMHAQNIVSFNAMIAAYAQHRQGEVALALYQRMQHEGMNPDHVTFISTLDACAGLVDLVQTKVLHVYLVESGVVSDVVVETALMNMYSKCGDFRGANKIFESLAKRDVASWNAMIAAYSQHGRGKEVVKLFKRMREEDIKPDEITFVSVLSACSHAGLINEGKEYFDSMSQVYDIEPTVEHYSCMADLYGRAGLLVEAENFLKKIPRHPSPVAWLTLLSACKVHGDVERAKHAADRIFELDSKHTGARMTLSNIYAVAGMWDDAANVIREIV